MYITLPLLNAWRLSLDANIMFFKTVPLIFLGIGVFILVQVAMPLLAFKAWELTSFSSDALLLDPSPQSQIRVLGVSVKNVGNFPAIISEKRREYLPFKEFSLSIADIGLESARVVVDSNEFEKNLAHLPGSALPGERGNIFVTGHSSLTQFFKEGNYKAVFAKLPEVKKGNTIKLEALGQHFDYVVEGIRIIDPKEVGVINPPDSVGRYLTLMTCVPPGFNTKRLVVIAKLK